MHRRFLTSWILSLSTCCALGAQSGGDAAAKATPDADVAVAVQVENAFRTVAERAFASVVTVTAYERDPAVGEAERRAASWVVDPLRDDYVGYRKIAVTSGFFVDGEGRMLCCRHGVTKADGTVVDLVSVETPDRQHTICDVLGSEPTLNLAVLRLAVFHDRAPPRYRPATMGDSTKVRPGMWAIGCGQPDGPEAWFGVGVFTAVPDRDCYQEQLAATFLQATLQVHPKAYGGPLLGVRGEVLGMLCPRFADPTRPEPMPYMGIEYALPSNIVRNLYGAIVAKGSHRSPWIGVAVMSRPELIRERGAEAFEKLPKPRAGILIENVFDPSPAFAAGVRPGDFMMRLGGNTIRTPLDFQRCLYLAGIGAEVPFGMWRDGAEYEVSLVVEARPAEASFR